uniref:Uncharacterized protein n=1 Tax=Lutzomyia longipalpis TaxID=7200 RepID=A0A3F2ZD89_LUTLO
MSLLHSLGFLLTIQKFHTIPNFSIDSKISFIIIVLRVIPICILILVGLFHPIILSILFPNYVSRHSVLISVANFVGVSEFLIHYMALSLIFALGIKYNRLHVGLLIDIISFEKKLKEQLKDFKTNYCFVKIIFIFEILIILFFNYGFSVSLFVAYGGRLTLYDIISHLVHTTTTMLNDSFILYICHILWELKKITFLLRNYLKKSQIKDNFTIINGFLKLIRHVNRALGPLIIITYLQHIISCSLGMYYIFWFSFNIIRAGFSIHFIFGSIFWAARDIFYLTFLSSLGNYLENQTDELLNWQNREEFPDTSKNKRENEYFCKHRLWIRHLERGVIASGSRKINNSGMFSIITFVINFMVILIQFQNMEDMRVK